MKHRILILLSLLWSGLAASAQISYDQQVQSIDPARLYLQRMGKGGQKTQSEELDPLTERRRQLRAFVPQGNWAYGLGVAYLTTNTRHTDLAFSGAKHAAMRLTGFSLQPFFSYAAGNNCLLGLRAGYVETGGRKDFWAEYEGEQLIHTYRKLDYQQQLYNVDFLCRAYVPLDCRLRWAAFVDVMLGYQGGTGRMLSTRDDVPYRSNFSLNQIRLSLHPGIALAITNNLSVDLSLGLANVAWTLQHEKNRDGQDLRTNGFRLNSLIDAACVQLGLTINH